MTDRAHRGAVPPDPTRQAAQRMLADVDWFVEDTRMIVLRDDVRLVAEAVVARSANTAETCASGDPHRQFVKENALRLADAHRDGDCAGADCTVSLLALGELLRLAGFELSPDDLGRLM